MKHEDYNSLNEVNRAINFGKSITQQNNFQSPINL